MSTRKNVVENDDNGDDNGPAAPKATKRRRLSKKVDTTNRSVTFNFLGDDGEVSATETFALADYPEAMQTRLALHGISQVLGDSIVNAEPGDEPRELMLARHKAIAGGTWSEGREIDRTKLIEAYLRAAERTGKTAKVDVVTAYVNGLDAKGAAEFRRKKAIAYELALMAGETGAADELPDIA
jgi:hypothetical protein